MTSTTAIFNCTLCGKEVRQAGDGGMVFKINPGQKSDCHYPCADCKRRIEEHNKIAERQLGDSRPQALLGGLSQSLDKPVIVDPSPEEFDASPGRVIPIVAPDPMKLIADSLVAIAAGQQQILEELRSQKDERTYADSE